MDMICRFYPFVYYIYLFGQCHCGFWFFCCFVAVRTFEITQIIWRSDMDMECGQELPGTTFVLRFPENTLERSLANHIQASNGPIV